MTKEDKEARSPSQFPSIEVVERIENLPRVNCTPTDLMGLSTEQMVTGFTQNYEGSVVIDFSKASKEERVAIRQAVQSMSPEANCQVTVLNPDGVVERDDEGFTKEDRILRMIDEGMLEEKSLGFEAFGRFIQITLEEHPNLVVEEWNTFIAGHPETGVVTSPLDTHHFHNVGLKTAQEGTDPLRDRVVTMVNEVMDQVKGQVEEIASQGGLTLHKMEDMNNPNNRLLALGMAEYSNFVRGAVYYGLRRPDDVNKYEPRRIAADCLNAVIGERIPASPLL